MQSESKKSSIKLIAESFSSPSNVFDYLSTYPRQWILALIVLVLAVTAMQVLVVEKIGLKAIVAHRLKQSATVEGLPKEQLDQIIAQQSGTMAKSITYISTPIALTVAMLLGGLIYLLGAKLVGSETMTVFNGFSVFIYSSIPPTLVMVAGSIIILLLKPSQDIDLSSIDYGLLRADLGLLMPEGTSRPLLAVLGSIGVFQIWGWMLAASGLQRLGRISAPAAWIVVLTLGVVGIAFKVLPALFFG